MIGLIFGETIFPKIILKNIKKRKIKYLIIDLTKKKIFKQNRNSYSVSLGQFGKILEILKKNKCKKVLFAGKVKKPNFYKLRLDMKGIYYFPRIIKSSKLGDAAILKEIIDILKKENIITIDSLFFSPELSLKKGFHSKIKPNRQDIHDINKAIKTLNNLNHYNHTQGVIVKKGKVMALEGEKGTQKMLKKFKNDNFYKNGVLVKYPKKKQDLRIDLPTVGYETFKQCKLIGLKGIVLKSKKNIFLDKIRCIKFANKNKLFILAK